MLTPPIETLYAGGTGWLLRFLLLCGITLTVLLLLNRFRVNILLLLLASLVLFLPMVARVEG